MSTSEPIPPLNSPPQPADLQLPTSEPTLTEADLYALQDPELQAKYRQEYLRQMECRRCEGCGE